MHALAQRKLTDREEAQPQDGAAATSARLEIMRLTREEMAFQPVPLLPGLLQLSAAMLQAAPRLRQSGPFSAFTVPAAASDQQWVVRDLSPYLKNDNPFTCARRKPCPG